MIAGTTPVLVHNSSACLGRNLGPKPATNAQAHHIVPENDPLAAQARDVLDKAGIGVDDAENGVWLIPRSHYTTYPKDYVRWVNNEIVQGYANGGAQGVRDALAEIKGGMQGANQWVMDQGY